MKEENGKIKLKGLPIINSQNIKVIAATSFMKASGEHGTPMFSRVGR